jgi:drug/metabolite transporter (DMT)-like permease
MRSASFAALLALNFVWASSPAVTAVLAPRLSPLGIVLLRFALGAASLLLVWPWLPGALPRGRDLLRAAGMGVVVFAVGHRLQAAGVQLSSASDASVLLALDPFITSLGAALFLHERVPGRRWLGFAVAMTGVVVLSLWRGAAGLGGSVPGNLLFILSFVGEAVWTVVGKPLADRYGVPRMVAVALLAGTVANALLALPHAGTLAPAIAALPWTAWAMLALLGVVGTAVGYGVWYVVIRHLPVSVAAMTIYLQPVLGALLAWLWVGERPHGGHAVGGAIIVTGLCLGLWPARRPGPAGRCAEPAPEPER